MAGSSRSSRSSKQVAALVTLLALLGPAAAGPCPEGWKAACDFIAGVISIPSPSSNPKPAPTGANLTVGHYDSTCPKVEDTVRRFVSAALDKDPGVGAGLIRLHFHDCFVQGCDGSVLLNQTALGDTTTTEQQGAPNLNSLRSESFKVINDIKAVLENKTDKDGCPDTVSCADVLAIAARDASNILSKGNVTYAVPKGRRDGVRTSDRDTNTLPGPGFDITQLNTSFTNQGLDLLDAVDLSAGHSIGHVRCRFTRDQPAMDQGYKNKLIGICGSSPGNNDDKTVDQDPFTANVLDTQYYTNIDKFVMFRSDAVLIKNDDTRKRVQENIADPKIWAGRYAASMVKMGNIGVMTSPGPNNQIRKVCWKVNGR